MKKVLKCVCLIAMLMFITSCGWKDVQKDYADILNSNPSCKYYTSSGDANNDYFGIESFELSADYDGAYVSFGNNAKTTIADTTDDYYTDYNGFMLDFTNSFLKSYLNAYKDNGYNCPQSIYISTDITGGFNRATVGDCQGMDYACEQYNLQTATVTTPEGEKKECHHNNAINCKKVSKDEDQFGPKVYLEFGYYKSNNEIKKYFGVAKSEKYSDITLDTKEEDGLVVYSNLEYYVITDDAINEIYLDNNGFISSDKIVIMPATSISSKMYYITGQNSDNYGDNYKTGEIKDVPEYKYEEGEIKPIKPDALECTGENSLLGSTSCASGQDCEPAFYVQVVFNVMKYVAIILLIVMSTFDFLGAVGSSDDGAMKKAMNKCIIRLILCVLIFFIPTILEYIFTLIKVYTPSTCGIK